MIFTCDTCGEQRHSPVAHARFCSKKCSNKYWAAVPKARVAAYEAEIARLQTERDGLLATLQPWQEQGPWFLRANIDEAVEALRDKCIDLVAMHGGSVEIEAAIRGA